MPKGWRCDFTSFTKMVKLNYIYVLLMIAGNFNDETTGATSGVNLGDSHRIWRHRFMGASSCKDFSLTYCGQVTSYDVMKRVQQSNNGSSSDLSPVRHQVISWTNVELLSIGPLIQTVWHLLPTKFSQTSTEIRAWTIKYLIACTYNIIGMLDTKHIMID